MKFVHFADSHIGGWRVKELQECNLLAFKRTMQRCKELKVDFLLIAGDLFNTSLPSIDYIKEVTKEFYELKNLNIPVYIIAGSHDYSPSGKTMLDVLEEAGLVINVTKATIVENKLRLLFTQDEKTGVKITGLLGKRGMLDKMYYQILDREYLENEPGRKIFMFHTAVEECKPRKLETLNCTPLTFFPKNFFYYAGGHVHIIMNEVIENYGRITYPGALFPNSFDELEEFKHGGFYIVDDDDIKYEEVKIKDVVCFRFDVTNKTPEQAKQDILHNLSSKELNDKIVTLRIYGKFSEGRITDLNIPDIIEYIYSKKAYSVLHNTTKLFTDILDEIIIERKEKEDIENSIINEHMTEETKFQDMSERELSKMLINLLHNSKEEGETKNTHEDRIKSDLVNTIKILD